MPANGQEEQDVKIVSIQPLDFTRIRRKMEPSGNRPAPAFNPEFQESPVRFPFCPYGKKILENSDLFCAFPQFINPSLKIPGPRER